jgi:hypothetical protein
MESISWCTLMRVATEIEISRVGCLFLHLHRLCGGVIGGMPISSLTVIQNETWSGIEELQSCGFFPSCVLFPHDNLGILTIHSRFHVPRSRPLHAYALQGSITNPVVPSNNTPPPECHKPKPLNGPSWCTNKCCPQFRLQPCEYYWDFHIDFAFIFTCGIRMNAGQGRILRLSMVNHRARAPPTMNLWATYFRPQTVSFWSTSRYDAGG